MITYLKVVISISCLSLLSGCNLSEIWKEPEIVYPQDYSIVFCDFTSSVDTLYSMEKIKNDALQLLDRNAGKKKLEFYTISKDNNTACLFGSRPIAINFTSGERRAFEDNQPKKRDSLKTLLNRASSDAAAKLRKEPNSCIIDCVERAIRYFRNAPGHDTAHLQLYILSDMLECCSLNGKQKVCIEPPGDIKITMENIPPVSDSSLSFREFKNVELYIILSSNQRQEGVGSDFYNFWKMIFKRYSYDKTIYYDVKLPDETRIDK